jgi:ATP-binding cassette subfamily B multidrug efflux pump
MSTQHEEEALGKAYDSRLMRRLLGYLRPYRWRVVMALALVAIVTPLELAPPLLFRKAIDTYFVPAIKNSMPENQAWRGIEIISVVFLLVLIFDFLAQYLQIRIMQRVGQQTMYDMRSEIFGHLQRLPMSYFDRNPVGRLVTRVTTDVDALNDLFAAGVVTMINDFFLLAVMAGVLFWIDARLALATLAVLPGILVITLIFRKFVRDANRRIRTAIARINAFLQEYISGMHVVQLFNREQKARAEFHKRNRENMLAWRDAILAYALFYPAVEFMSFATIALIYWTGGMRILHGALSLGVLTAFTMFAQRFFRPIQDLSEKFNILQSAMAASERIFKLLDEPITITSDPNAIPLKNPLGEIEFRNVARPSLSSDTPAPAKPRLFPCCCASTTFSVARFCSTAWTSAPSTCRICAASSASCCRIPSCSPEPSNPIFAWELRASIGQRSSTPFRKSASAISCTRFRKASPPKSTSAAPLFPSGSANSSISRVPWRTIRVF